MPRRALIADYGKRDRSFQFDPDDYALRALVMRLANNDLLGVDGITPQVIQTWAVIVRYWPSVEGDSDTP